MTAIDHSSYRCHSTAPGAFEDPVEQARINRLMRNPDGITFSKYATDGSKMFGLASDGIVHCWGDCDANKVPSNFVVHE